MNEQITVRALLGIPTIRPGDDFALLIAEGIRRTGLSLVDGDIIVIAQKIVSKAQDRTVDLTTVEPGERARSLAAEVEKDPRLVEVILGETEAVIRQAPGVLITQHLSGWIMANAGIDASNVGAVEGEETVLLLPEDPDRTCEEIRDALGQALRLSLGVVINDSFGRPWRLGTTSVALGAAGLPSLWDRRGETDLYGRLLRVSQQAVADQLACAASLVQGEAAEGTPVAVIQGYRPQAPGAAPPPHRPARDLVRSAETDLFR